MGEAEAPTLWPDAKSWLTRKDPDAGKDRGQEEKVATENEMFGSHHWINGHKFEQIPRGSEGHGSLASFSPRVANSGTRLSDWINPEEGNCTIPVLHTSERTQKEQLPVGYTTNKQRN